MAFITSGGTVVPLEVNAVRYITNFSSGGRGAYFVEAFAKRKWCCILLHHRDAVQPFRRVIDRLSTDELFDLITENKKSNISDDNNKGESVNNNKKDSTTTTIHCTAWPT